MSSVVSRCSGQSTEDYGNSVAGNPVTLHSIAAQPHMFLGAGELPIVRDGQVIGAIGVSGGTGAQEVEVAEAALAALP
jgi:glc operon protein GlcG